MNEILTSLCRHHRWANLRPIDACAALDDELQAASAPGTFGGVRDILVEVVANEENYLALFDGAPSLARGAVAIAGFDDLRRRARRDGKRLIANAERTEGDPVVRGEWRAGGNEGEGTPEPFAHPTSIFVIQALGHAAEHRAHVATILGSRAIEPPALDAWADVEASDRD